mgnify:CR=1 FL=1
MAKVKINNKTYNVGELEFKDYTHMEEQGFSIVDAFSKNQFMLIAMGFTCVVLGCDREQAENTIQQHILGGGNVRDITTAFAEAVSESDFFRKMLGMNEVEQEPEEMVEEEKPKTARKTGGRQTQAK